MMNLAKEDVFCHALASQGQRLNKLEQMLSNLSVILLLLLHHHYYLY